jgi:NhaP-type Na+/H+ or K+/H+ antiporter
MSIETLLKTHVAVSGLLAVITMACVLKLKADPSVTSRLSAKFGKLWLAAEVMLFVLVGAAVDVRYTLSAGRMAVLMIFIALTFRAVGVALCTLGTKLNGKERLFCVIAYLPKATVQAAIGSVPLSLGLPCGKIVLSVAVLAILITAPLGAFGIDQSYPKLLDAENER